MSKKPESRLQLKIRRALENEVGGYWRKVWGGPFQSVFLDLIGCVDGQYYELEVKMPKKHNNTSELQELAIQKIKRAGGCAGVVTSADEAIRLVRQAQARAKRSR